MLGDGGACIVLASRHTGGRTTHNSFVRALYGGDLLDPGGMCRSNGGICPRSARLGRRLCCGAALPAHLSLQRGLGLPSGCHGVCHSRKELRMFTHHSWLPPPDWKKRKELLLRVSDARLFSHTAASAVRGGCHVVGCPGACLDDAYTSPKHLRAAAAALGTVLPWPPMEVAPTLGSISRQARVLRPSCTGGQRAWRARIGARAVAMRVLAADAPLPGPPVLVLHAGLAFQHQYQPA